jgi:hypothetical protein
MTDTDGLPHRGGAGTAPRGFPLPPGPMPAWYRRRPLKRWCYAGVFGPDGSVCAGVVHVAGLPQAFWAVWDRSTLVERTTVLRRAGVEVSAERVRVAGAIDLSLEPAGDPVDVVSPHGRAHIWTRKTPVHAVGTVTVSGATRPVDAFGLVDETAGYHARSTAWEWSAGVGTSTDGRRVGWNLVTGVHDAVSASERTVWVDGVAGEVAPVTFSEALDAVTFAGGERLRFHGEAARRRRDRLVLLSSDYEQPFGVFAGSLPGGLALREGFGVMERHWARW